MLIINQIQKSILLLIALLTGVSSVLFAQADARRSLSLTEAYTLLEARYPALRNGSLWGQIQQQQEAQISADYQPGLHWKTDARVQSESVQLDTPEGGALPFEISQPLVTAQTYLEGTYLLLDGGSEDARKALLAAETAVQIQSVEVDR